jgi:hypothetical protein
LDAREFLSRNDAYHFVQPRQDLVVTSPTKTIVNNPTTDRNHVRRIHSAAHRTINFSSAV